jgi:hypothetical protein
MRSEKNEQVLPVDDEHMDAVEQGLQEADAGLTKLMTGDDWARLSQRITEIASRGHHPSIGVAPGGGVPPPERT